MDASYLLAFLVFGGGAWFAGHTYRRFTLQREALDRVSDSYADADAHADTSADACTIPDCHRHGNGPAFYLAQHRDARRLAISRPHIGPRPGRHAAGGVADFSDAAAVA